MVRYDVRATRVGALHVSGSLWIVSYLVLIASVLGLFLAVAALYRSFAQPGRVNDIYSWPLQGLTSGSRIPPWLEDRLAGLSISRDQSFLCVVTSIEIDSYACTSAARRAAEVLDWRAVAVVRTDATIGSVPGKLLRVGDIPCIEATRSEFAALGVSDAPVLVYWRGSTVIDAAPGLVSPSEIIRFFAPLEAAARIGHLSVFEGGA